MIRILILVVISAWIGGGCSQKVCDCNCGNCGVKCFNICENNQCVPGVKCCDKCVCVKYNLKPPKN